VALLSPPAQQLRRRAQGLFVTEKGAALIEFALVLPFLMLVIAGVVDLGRAVAYWNDQTHLASQTARYAAVNACAPCVNAGLTINEYMPTQAETAELQDALDPDAHIGSGQGIFIRFTGPTAPTSKNHCIGQAVKVTVKSHYSLPFLGNIPFVGGHFGLTSIEITASATSRLEQHWGGTNGSTGLYTAGTDKYWITNTTNPFTKDNSTSSQDDCNAP